MIQWLAQLPDLNPIENVWGELSRQVSRERPANKNELLRCLFHCCGNLTTNYIQSLYRSLPRRVRGVIRSWGYGTKYQNLSNIFMYIKGLALLK